MVRLSGVCRRAGHPVKCPHYTALHPWRFMEYVFLFIRLYRFAEYHRLAVLAVEERYVAVRQLISQISAAAKIYFPGSRLRLIAA